jgi:predicted O-methyltransferase YrrM
MASALRLHVHHVRRLAGARVSDPEAVAVVRRVRARGLTYLDEVALLDLRRWVRHLEAASIPGAVVEAGCALGGSAIVLASAKRSDRPMFVYDVFGTIPAPSAADGPDVHARYAEIMSGEARGIEGAVYYGYRDNLLEQVAASFEANGVPLGLNNVSLVPGLFEDTISPEGPVALAHIDGDWYESVQVCLERLWPAMSPGGVVILDDFDDWTGCRTAVEEFLGATRDVEVRREARLQLVKRTA